MSAKNNTHRADLRNTLLANGYTPLPLLSNGKGLYIKGWSAQDVDTEWLAGFARRSDYQNTGLRCDQLCALDIDVTDEALADEIEQFIEADIGETKLCRVGSWPKRLLLYRMEGKPPFRSCRTGKYGDDGHMVELLCGNGRQFAAFGKHPSGVEYEWCDDVSPSGVAFKKLPKVSYLVAAALIDKIGALFADAGLEQQSPGLAFGHAGLQEWDLTDDFECLTDGEIVPWGELRDQLDAEGVFGNIRREDGEFGDSDAVHFMLAHGSQQPCLHDFVRDCTHWDRVVNPELALVLPERSDDIFTPDFVATLRDEYVLLPGEVRHVEHPQRSWKFADFKMLHSNWTLDVGTAAKPKFVSAVDAWKQASDTQRAEYAALRPESEAVIVPNGSLSVFNTYAPPEHPETGGEIDTCIEFIDHLIPSQRERDLFWDWHALKVAHPHWRMHGFVMVTRAYGTGRGTWTQILQRMLGSDYVREIPLSSLTGSGSQSQFNEYLADSLIIAVPEALEEKEDQGRWLSRHLAYERLKTVIDPIAAKAYIQRKYGKNSSETVYASLLISSNHVDALAIEPRDRRIIVIDNTEKPLWDAPGDLISRIQLWKDDPKNIGALHRQLQLRAMSVTYDPFGEPPSTPAKERMIEAGQSDADLAFEWMVETAKGDLVTPAQWRAFAQQARSQLQLDLPLGDKLDAALTAVIQKRGRRIEGLPRAGIKVQGSPQRPWIIRNFDTWKGSTEAAQIRAEILKNGAAGGSVVPFPPQKPK